MFQLIDTITNERGDALPGYYVKLKNSGGTYAPLYSDASGTPIIASSGVADAALGDAFGTVSLFVDDGTYTIEIFDTDATTLRRAISGVQMLGYQEATNSQIWTGATPSVYVSPLRLYSSAAPVALTDAATIAVDLNAGFNFNVTLGGNRTLGNPTNAKVGQSGRIRVTQDGTGGRTLAYAANWKHVGSVPTIATGAGAVNLFAYYVNGASDIELSYIGTIV